MLAPEGVKLRVGADEWVLRFTWDALIRMHDAWGEDFEKRVGQAVRGRNLRDLAFIVSVSGGPPEDDVIARGPAILALRDCLEVAWAWAYNGYEAAERFQAELQKEREADKTPAKKLHPLASFYAFATQWRTRSAPT